jgi:hypothetical protein
MQLFSLVWRVRVRVVLDRYWAGTAAVALCFGLLGSYIHAFVHFTSTVGVGAYTTPHGSKPPNLAHSASLESTHLPSAYAALRAQLHTFSWTLTGREHQSCTDTRLVTDKSPVSDKRC